MKKNLKAENIGRWALTPSAIKRSNSSPGCLFFDEKGHTSLGLIESNIDKKNMKIEKRRYPALYGYVDGWFYTLLKPQCTFLQTNLVDTIYKERYFSNLVLKSKQIINTKGRIKEVLICFQNIRDWVKDMPFEFVAKYDKDPVTSKSFYPKYIASYNPLKAKDHIIYSSETLDIEVRYRPDEDCLSRSIYDKGKTISFEVDIVCIPKNNITINEVQLKIINPVRSIFALMFGFFPEIKELKLNIEDIYAFAVDSKYDKAIEDIQIFKEDLILPEKHFNKKSIQKFFASWFNILSHENNLVLKGAMKMMPHLKLKRLLFAESDFINMALAFESFCKYDLEMKKFDSKIYKNILSKVKNTLKDCKEVEIINHILEAIGHENRKSQRLFIEEANFRIAPFSNKLIQDFNMFLDNHVKSRNSYIHSSYEKKCLKASDLVSHTNTLFLLNYAFMLYYLGEDVNWFYKKFQSSYFTRDKLIDSNNLYMP